MNRGIVYFKTGQWVKAMEDLQTVASRSDMHRYDPKLIHTIALCKHRAGDLEGAVNEYTMCVGCVHAWVFAGG